MNLLQDITRRLQSVYPSGEARAVARVLLEDGFQLSMTDILLGKDNELSAEQRSRLEKCVLRLLAGEPVQYVTGTCFFLGRPFSVRPGCLIPRPETEDLVMAIVEFFKQHPFERIAEPSNYKNRSLTVGTGLRHVETGEEGNHAHTAENVSETRPYSVDESWIKINEFPPLRVLDIGTGSGCIAVSLAFELGETAQVEAWDISADALAIARENAKNLHSIVDFRLENALNPSPSSASYDLIVSNPPYVRELEKADMQANVLDHEPATALFVPDDDPLIFYRSIGHYAFRHLTPGGTLWFETNRYLITDTADLLKNIGFSPIETITDRFGHPRHLKATRP